MCVLGGGLDGDCIGWWVTCDDGGKCMYVCMYVCTYKEKEEGEIISPEEDIFPSPLLEI